MSREHPFLTTPVAILFAGVAIGVGLYAGLRSRAGEVAPPPTVSRSVPPVPGMLPGPDGVPAPVRRADPAAVQQAARVAGEAELASHREALRVACWVPIADVVPVGTTVTVTVDVTFNPAGAQVARGTRVQPPQGFAANNPVSLTPAVRALGSVGGCIQRTLPALTIPAPGRQVRLELPLTLP